MGFTGRSWRSIQGTPKVFVLRGTIATKAGRPDIAADLFSLAVDAAPNNASFHFGLGDCLGTLGRRDDANAQYALGVLLHGAEQAERKARCLRNCLILNPARADALNALGACRKAAGALGEAAQLFHRAARLHPDAHVWFNLANTLHDRTAFDAALVAFRNAVAMHPGHAGLYNNLAIALNDAWRLDDAEIAYRRALDLAPARMEAHSAYLAFQYYRSGVDDGPIIALARQFGEAFKADEIARPRTRGEND